ncbi:MAG TPA: molybdopterin molybdenumtransferase MoeA, partial [Myxococcaceae bacterium]|nr:molybdopterin molybdenumtransferase MoeA [Myxococcaceae bacterium]
PLLLRHQGVTEERQRLRVRLHDGRHKRADLSYLLAAHLEHREDGLPRARLQGRGQLLQNLGAEGFVHLPPGRADFAPGDIVDFECFAHPRFLPLREGGDT